MNRLTDDQRQLIFDYILGLTTPEQAAQAQKLIDSNPQASQIGEKLKAAFAPLDSLEDQTCPDDLVESTIFRLNNAARSSQLNLQQLLAAEQKRKVTTASWFWQNVGSRLAMAAAFMVIGTIMLTAFNTLSALNKEGYLNRQCQMQLGRIFRGINSYSNDHEGLLPSVAVSAGDPWWKVGAQGNENHSNTRHAWLLIKEGYASPNDFVCPASNNQKLILRVDSAGTQKYYDFPTRRHINYSMRLICDDMQMSNMAGADILMSDSNPLFVDLPDSSNELELKINKALLKLNSFNHKCKGQNVLCGDGSVGFAKKRQVGIAQDDIFTLQNTDVYKGSEMPRSSSDVFLAP